MEESGSRRFRKAERISSDSLADKLFNRHGSRSMAAFPIRMVYMKHDPKPQEPAVRVVVCAPKRQLRHAVSRNRAKRQMREAYRKNKSILYDAISQDTGKGLAIAFIWTDGKLWDTRQVEERIKNLMQRLAEKGVWK